MGLPPVEAMNRVKVVLPELFTDEVVARCIEAQARLFPPTIAGRKDKGFISLGNVTKVNFNRASPPVEVITSESADSADSQFELGKKYHDGDGVKRDFEKAAECYSIAAKLGHARAQNNLGLLYLVGFGTNYRNKNEAAAWFMKAADQGLDIAQYNIASYFLEKNGVLPYDPAQAAMWYRKAAEQGNSDAQYSLGEMFEEGLGVPQDVHQAKSFYLKAALQDDEAAQSWLWRRAHLESTERPIDYLEDAKATVAISTNFRLAPDHATALVRATIDLLKQNPMAFLAELAELHSLILANNVATPSQAASSQALPFSFDTTPLAKVARWLLDQESVTLVALRSYLLPLDLLPGAVIDELNEHALDLTGEPALEQNEKESVLVAQEILTQVLACWNVA
jgi:TPR repeat protein